MLQVPELIVSPLLKDEAEAFFSTMKNKRLAIGSPSVGKSKAWKPAPTVYDTPNCFYLCAELDEVLDLCYAYPILNPARIYWLPRCIGDAINIDERVRKWASYQKFVVPPVHKKSDIEFISSVLQKTLWNPKVYTIAGIAELEFLKELIS